MLTWIMSNLGTIVITFFLILMVAGILWVLIRDHRSGRSSCGGSCGHCNVCNCGRRVSETEAAGNRAALERAMCEQAVRRKEKHL